MRIKYILYISVMVYFFFQWFKLNKNRNRLPCKEINYHMTKRNTHEKKYVSKVNKSNRKKERIFFMKPPLSNMSALMHHYKENNEFTDINSALPCSLSLIPFLKYSSLVHFRKP